MKKSDYENLRPLFFEQIEEKERQEKERTKSENKAVAKEKRRIRRHNFFGWLGDMLVRLVLSALLTLVVSLAVSILLTAINKDISLAESFFEIIDKIKGWLL